MSYDAFVYPQQVESDLPAWTCEWCGGAAEDEESLLDHQDWCLGDAASNTALLRDVDERDGELTQAALVAEAARRRASPPR